MDLPASDPVSWAAVASPSTSVPFLSPPPGAALYSGSTIGPLVPFAPRWMWAMKGLVMLLTVSLKCRVLPSALRV